MTGSQPDLIRRPSDSPRVRRAAAGLAATLAAAVMFQPMTVVAQDRPTAPVPCVEVDIGGERTGSLECLNGRLRAAARLPVPVPAGPPVDPNAPAPRLGLTNDAAFRQRMGAAYGASIRPARPTPDYRPILPTAPSRQPR